MTAQAEPAQSVSRLYAPAPDMRARLRVAVIACPRSSLWLARFIESAAGESAVDVRVLVAADERACASAPSVPLDLRAYLALEKLRRRGRNGVLAGVDFAASLPAVGIDVQSVVAADLAARLAEWKPDLVLAALPAARVDALARDAAFACWRIGSDLTDEDVAGLAFLTPMLDGDVVTRTELRAQAADGSERLLADGDGATQGGSFGLQRDYAFRKLPAMLLRVLRRIARGDLAPPRGAVMTLRFAPAKQTALTVGVGMRAFSTTVRNTMNWHRRLRRGAQSWFVALRRSAAALDPAAPTVGDVVCLQAPPGLYWADPCFVDAGERRLVFVEEYVESEQRGVIACIELVDGVARRLGIALDMPHHLSYPQVFAHDGAWFMTVESGAVRRASLYRASGFPLVWTHCGDLLSGCVCVDPTLHHHDGRWYLFTNVSDGGSATSDELFLFTAPTLEGPFQPHPCNPIVQDVRRARPAGRLFEHAGRLMRPAQDCAPEYGSAVVFNEVLDLSPTTYRERPLARLDGSWMPGLWGCHTYTGVAGADMLDACGVPAAGAARMVAVDEPAIAGVDADVPIVTALMPVYNGERFLAQAIESVLAQTLANVEVVVVNDGSKDGSGAIADRYAAQYPERVRVVHQENRGLPLARNAAIDAARGRYFALLDADDVWLPGHLEACVAVLERDPGVGLVHANAEDIDADGTVFGQCAGGRWASQGLDAFKEVLLRRQHVTCPTAVFRRSIVERVGAFDARFNRLGCEDRDQWLRIALATRLHYLDELHAQYRVHGSNMSANSERMWQARRVLVDKFARYPRGHALERRALAALDAERGHELAIEADAWPALRSFLRALRRDPLRMDAWKGLVRRLVVGRRPGAVVRP